MTTGSDDRWRRAANHGRHNGCWWIHLVALGLATLAGWISNSPPAEGAIRPMSAIEPRESATETQATETQAIEAGRQALTESARFPWYDRETDGPRMVGTQADQTDLERSPEWVASPTKKRPPTVPRRANAEWTLIGPQLASVLSMLAWTAIAVLFAVILYYWWHSVSIAWKSIPADDDTDVQRSESQLIEQLPFQVQRPTTDLLAEALRHYQQENYDEAIIYLHSHQLVQLDRHQLIRIEKGKTNRQYASELGQRSVLTAQLTRTMLAFEDVFFGHHRLTRKQFEACWHPLDVFERVLNDQPQVEGTAS